MLAGPNLDLARPGNPGQQPGDIDGISVSSPIGLRPIAPAGIGAGWLF
jgi:hypothetical protein